MTKYSSSKRPPGRARLSPKLTPEQSAKLDDRLLSIDNMMKADDSRPLSEHVVHEIIKKTARGLHSFPSRKRSGSLLSFEYAGLRSLRSPHIFQQILASSVEQTGLAYDFRVRGNLRNVDEATDLFQYHAYFFLSAEDLTAQRAMLGITALAIHSASIHRVFLHDQVYVPDEKVIGLHAAAIQKHPNEAVALTFGLAIAALQSEWCRSPTALIHSPATIELKAIHPADIRDAIRIVAESRNRDLRADNGQFRRTFLQLSRLLTKLQVLKMRGRHRR